MSSKKLYKLEDPRWRQDFGSWALMRILKRHGLIVSVSESERSPSKYLTFRYPANEDIPPTTVRCSNHRHPKIKCRTGHKPNGLNFNHQIRSDKGSVRNQVLKLCCNILGKYDIQPDQDLIDIVGLQKHHIEAELKKVAKVYVSETLPCKFGRYTQYAYLLADTDKALHKFARSIGLERSWFQGAPKHKHHHYDLFGSKIEQARKAGAHPILIREYIKGKINA